MPAPKTSTLCPDARTSAFEACPVAYNALYQTMLLLHWRAKSARTVDHGWYQVAPDFAGDHVCLPSKGKVPGKHDSQYLCHDQAVSDGAGIACISFIKWKADVPIWLPGDIPLVLVPSGSELPRSPCGQSVNTFSRAVTAMHAARHGKHTRVTLARKCGTLFVGKKRSRERYQKYLRVGRLCHVCSECESDQGALEHSRCQDQTGPCQRTGKGRRTAGQSPPSVPAAPHPVCVLGCLQTPARPV